VVFDESGTTGVVPKAENDSAEAAMNDPCQMAGSLSAGYYTVYFTSGLIRMWYQVGSRIHSLCGWMDQPLGATPVAS
jgi:hypothetical protein